MASLGGSSGFSSTPQSFHALIGGKSIPRSLTKIPKNQQKLLDRPDSWFMGIKGNNEAANVPLEVIQSLKDFHTAHTLPPPAQKPQPPVSSAPSLTAPAKSQTVNTFSDRADGSPVSSPPGTPVSWPSSPERPGDPAVGNSSPCLSIKSQLGVESQLPAPSPTAGLPSSPPRCESSPIAPAPKRPNPPAGLLQPNPKRPRIGTFPSSSAGLEDELETCIPDAIDQATPWTNKAAARLLTASQAVTSPPCGQGSMIPSTYNDAKSPAKSSTPKKRRNMKVISAADWSSSASTVAEEPIIPLSQPQSREKALPASSGPCIASTYAIESQTPQENQVVQDTPGKARTNEEQRQGVSGEANNHEEGRQDTSGEARNIEDERQLIPSGLGTIQEENQSVPGRLRILQEERQCTPVRPTGLEQNLLEYQATLSANLPEVDVVMGGTNSGNPPLPELMLPNEEELREDLRSWLDDVWGRQKLDWLPAGLQQHRTRLSRSSLGTLKRITLLAEKRAINLGSLWSQPDGPLRQASQHNNGRLSFPDDLSHESIEFLVQTARQAEKEKEKKRAASFAKAAAAAARLERRVNSATAEKVPTIKVEDSESDTPRPAPPSGPSDEAIAEQFTRSPYEAFCAAYPSYSGSLMDFVRACLVVEYVQRKQTLPKWLYDDFIRAFGDGYIQYMDRMDKAVPPEKPITAVRWYVGNVDKPVFQRNVVTVESLSRVFEIYPDESKSASGTISPEVSPSPATAKLPTALPTNLPASDRNDAQITSPSPRDHTRSAQIAASVPAPSSSLQTQCVPEVQRTPQDEQLPIQEQATSECPNPAVSSAEPKSSPVNREKGKQRMVDENTPDKHVSATPKMQRQGAATHAEDDNVVFLSSNRQKAATPTEDDNVVFISSNPRLRPAPPKFIGQQAFIKQEAMQGPNSAFPSRTTPQKAPATHQAPATSEQARRVASITETRSPAQKPTASASRANILRPTPERPHARRTLPSSFDFGIPSRQASHSPARSTLSATTQDSRVKKPKKTEKDRQRDNERWKRKIERMAREGRLPESTPAPKGGDA